MRRRAGIWLGVRRGEACEGGKEWTGSGSESLLVGIGSRTWQARRRKGRAKRPPREDVEPLAQLESTNAMDCVKTRKGTSEGC